MRFQTSLIGASSLLDALDYLHKHTPPIIYFNIKPLNVHLTSRGKIKLLATGIASRINANAKHYKTGVRYAANLNQLAARIDLGKPRFRLPQSDLKWL